MDEYTRSEAVRSRWRAAVRKIIAASPATWRENPQISTGASVLRSDYTSTAAPTSNWRSFGPETRKTPQISTGASVPRSDYASTASPTSRWRKLRHVIRAFLEFQSPLRKRKRKGRHLAFGPSSFSITDFCSDVDPFAQPILYPSVVDADLFPLMMQRLVPPLGSSPSLSRWMMQQLDPPLGSSPSLSRWRVAKHAVVAILRMQSGRISGAKRSKRLKGAAISLANLNDLELKSVIGTDESSGKVYAAVHRQTGRAYALKELHCDSSQQQQIRREVEMFKELDHPNLVKCYEIFFADDSDLTFLLLEPLHGGFPGATSESELASLALKLLLGLKYLHRKRITHGDIKPSNIFVDPSGQVKLLYSGETLSKTPALPAEIGAIHDGFSWDIWSVGLCILKMCKGLNQSDRDAGFVQDSRLMAVPAPSEQKQPLSFDLNMSRMDIDLNKDVTPASSSQNEGALVWKPSTGLWSFLSACMRTDVHERQTAEELVEHPFFFKLPMENEDQLLPWKKEFQFSSKVEVQPPPSKIRKMTHAKRDVQLPVKEYVHIPLKKEKHLFHEREELSSLVNKKLKILMDDDEDGEYDVESPKDPTRGVPHEVPKRCIEHCKLFLPDCEFEKDKLVRMWIAEGCIDLGVTKRMEDVGNLYFDTLVEEEVIVPSKFDNVKRQMKYRFNKSKVVLLEQGNYLRINASNMDGIHNEVLHLTWQCKRLDRTFSDALKDLKQLHTLVVHEDCSAMISQLSSGIFLGLRLLKTLDLSRTHISEIPGSIGKLESLQYLDVSETPIKRLPESLDRLYRLQTLNLRACVGVTALPRGFGRLVNLRHLDLDIVSQLKSMPGGMGNLIELQTLQAFIVGKNDGCGIGELKNMNEITGSFCISRLENVTNPKEAKEAALCDKRYIDKLELRWHNRGNDNFQDTAEILESLQPHFDLKELQLTYYGGSKLPKWICNPAFTDLSSLTLYKCINCDILPSIGELPSLKILHVFHMENVRNINALFCRNPESKMFSAFPRLEELTLDSMSALEEWTGVESGDFPCLHHVSIKYCPKLRVLPSLSHLSSLKHFEISNCTQVISLPEGALPPSLDSLIIRGCPGLNERCRKDGGVDWSKIASIGNIWIDLEKISLD